jgi:TldD protein
VAAKGVTVLDDGTIADRRGSLNVDDEGNASQRNVLIEDGILKATSRTRSTRTSRRQAHRQRPRKLRPHAHAAHDQHLHAGGDKARKKIVASIVKACMPPPYGGQVDITSGVLSSASEASVENGKFSTPSRRNHRRQRP